MGPNDYSRFTLALMRLAEVLGGRLTPQRTQGYQEALADYAIEALEKAMRDLSKTDQRFPLPARIREVAAKFSRYTPTAHQPEYSNEPVPEDRIAVVLAGPFFQAQSQEVRDRWANRMRGKPDQWDSGEFAGLAQQMPQAAPELGFDLYGD